MSRGKDSLEGAQGPGSVTETSHSPCLRTPARALSSRSRAPPPPSRSGSSFDDTGPPVVPAPPQPHLRHPSGHPFDLDVTVPPTRHVLPVGVPSEVPLP